MEINTGVERVDEWAQGRLVTPEGEWVGDTMFCVLYSMENCPPPFLSGSEWDKEDEEKYKALIKIACSYLLTSGNVRDAFDFGCTIEEDSRKLPLERKVELRKFIWELLPDTRGAQNGQTA